MNIVKQKSNLIPYRINQGIIEFYLSHRSKNAKQYPDYWSFWGGGIEMGENSEDALIREIKEELNFNLNDFEFLGVYYDSMPNKKFIYFTKVNLDFEHNIEILESQGGQFFSIDNIRVEDRIIQEDKRVLEDIFILLKNKI